MSDRPRELSSFVSPDSLRQFLTMMKHYYNIHTPRSMESVDADGVHYAGTVENFGSEILAETHHMRSKKPPIGLLNISDMMQFYFEIQHSNFITTFEQQNMVCGLLRGDRLIHGATYELIYSNLVDMYVFRSESTSDPIVRRDLFLYTTTPPTLQITSPNGDVTTTSLFVSDSSETDTRYFIPVNETTVDLLGGWNAIANIISTGTCTITLDRVNIPYIWLCVEDFETLPDVTIQGNTDALTRPLLTTGTNGHLQYELFPMVQGPTNLPAEIVLHLQDPDVHVYLRARGDFTSNREFNMNTTVSQIEYIVTTDITAEPAGVHIVKCDDAFVKFQLSRDVEWIFHRPTEGDYDYNPTGVNAPYAYVAIKEFDGNYHQNIFERKDLIAGFMMQIDERYVIHSIEQLMNHTVTGIHVDDSCEQSQHAVDKLHGVVHDLGQFDGLPRYFAAWMKRETHRAHVEMYAIRDSIVKNNPMNRQTAAVIVDSATPQTDLNMILDGLTVVIEYDEAGVFETTGESESATNNLSDTVYIDDDTVASMIPEYIMRPKFVYHGNGIFSLGMAGLDPEMEFGRVYAITNDPSTYENNEIAINPKAGRCIARVCDIPTSFLQLTHIPQWAPTFALDPSYTRQEASFNESERNKLWNFASGHFVSTISASGIMKLVFDDSDDLDTLFPLSFLETNYPKKTNLNATIDMSTPSTATDYTFQVSTASPGEGYTINSRINTIIGGLTFEGTITGVDLNGAVTSIEMDDANERIVNAGNILSQNMICKTTTILGTGKELELKLHLTNEAWNALQVRNDGVLDDLIAFKFDPFNCIWIWTFDGTNWVPAFQVSGEVVADNRYDKQPSDYVTAYDQSYITSFPWNTRPLKDVFFYNEFYQSFRTWSPAKMDETVIIDSASDDSNIVGYNYQESLYSLTSMNKLYMNTSVDSGKWKLLPQDHQYNAYNADMNLAALVIDKSQTQPGVSIYDPMLDQVNTYDSVMDNMLRITNSKPMTFADKIDSDILGNGILTEDVYRYSYVNDYKALCNMVQSIEARMPEQNMEYVEETFPGSAPVRLKDSDNPYSPLELIDFIAQRTVENPIYQHSDLTLFRTKGDMVLNGSNPVGEQPTGGYVPLKDTWDCRVTVDHVSETSIPTYVFKIESEIESLDGFHMYDAEGNDISSNTLLLVNGKLYTYNGAWIEIHTSSN